MKIETGFKVLYKGECYEYAGKMSTENRYVFKHVITGKHVRLSERMVYHSRSCYLYLLLNTAIPYVEKHIKDNGKSFTTVSKEAIKNHGGMKYDGK